EAAHRAERGIDEQRVQRCRLVGQVACLVWGHGVGHGAASSSGTVISRLRIFPVGPLGKASTNHTRRGYLYAATCALTKVRSSSAPTDAPGLSTTAAPTSSPSSACGMPTTAASATHGCS